MKERTILKIGEFARVGQVSIATLRHYDQCGLLKPNALDPDTSYRYYSLDQLARLNRILALKELDFPLEQIGRVPSRICFCCIPDTSCTIKRCQ